MTRTPQHVAIPKPLRRYFWEYDAARLSLEENQHTVVLRLLRAGGLDAVRWLRASRGDDAVRDVMVRRRGRGIDPPRLRFWALVLDLPREQVDGWIAADRTNHGSRGPEDDVSPRDHAADATAGADATRGIFLPS